MRFSRWHVCQIGFRENYAIPRALIKAGRNVNLITDFWREGNSSDRCHPDLVNRNVKSFNLAFLCREFLARVTRKSSWRRMEDRNKWFSRKASRALVDTANPGDIVFSYSYGALEIFRQAKKMGCRTILGQIDPGPEEHKMVRELQRKHGMLDATEPAEQYWQRWTQECELADIIMVNSEWSRRNVIAAGVDARKVVVVPLAYEATFTSKVVSQERTLSECSPLKILFLGQLVVRKGIMETIEAISVLQDKHIEWTFVGSGPEAVVTRLNEFSNVKVVGQVRHGEVENYYRSADVFLLPTHSDGFGLTQLEALRYGVPMIVSSHCGDVVEHGRTGVILEAITSEEIVDLVNSLLKEPSQISSMKEAVEASDNKWTLNALSENLLRLEQEIVLVAPDD
jgi:glycosyltransferase involved in cell wall biosynthesis